MSKKLLILSIFLFMYFITSCETLINPSVNITFTPDTLDFGYVQANQKVSRSLKIVNTGALKLKIHKIELEFNESGTSKEEFKILSGTISQDVSLNKDESHDVRIEFSPKFAGNKSAQILVHYSVNEKALECRFSIKGAGYKGFIHLTPALLEFDTAYVGEENTESIHITNSDTKSLTIKSVAISSLGANTTSGEFRITSGWDGNPIKLNPGNTLNVKIAFKPASVNMKTARLTVNIVESHYDFNSTLAGLCCDNLEFITAYRLANAEHGKFSSYKIEGKGGDGKYTISVPNSNLPKGMSLNSDVISGTPEEHGNFGFTLVLQDDSGHTTYKTFILHINYAILYRDSSDVDTNYVFDHNNDTGSYIVNLIAEGDIALTITSIALSGAGYTSREATILSQPTLPHTMQNGDRTQVVIKVESLLDEGRDVTLTVNHTGYNSPFSNNFEWEIKSPQSYIFVLQRSGSMSSRFIGFTVYDRNGNIIPYPNRWQALQSRTAEKINALDTNDSFEVVTFATSIYVCFAQMRTATTGNKATAITWLYNQGTTG